MENRRTHPRFHTALSVEVFTGKDVIPAQAQNLSLGGVGIAVDSPLQEQAQVGLSMFLVEDGIEDERTDALNVRGQVIWCTPSDTAGFLAGIRFAPLQAAELQKIQHFLVRLVG